MGKYSVLGYFVAMMYLALLVVVTYTYQGNSEREFEEIRLQRAVNVSVDAAIEDILMAHPNVDLFNMVVDPDRVSDVFFNTFLISYDMAQSEENKQTLYTYVPLLVLLLDDGFYVGQGGYTDDGTHWDWRWSDKIPFTLYEGNNVWALRISNENVRRYNWNYPTDSSYFEFEISYPDKKVSDRIIAQHIMSVVASYINQANEASRSFSNQFYIPAEFIAEYQAANIQGPTLMAFMQNVDLFSRKPIEAFGIGGAQLQLLRRVVAWTDGSGNKWYCYHDQYAGALGDVEQQYRDIYTASLDGYKPYLPWFT